MNHKTPPLPTTPSEERTVNDVQNHGWHVIKVGAEGDTPGWAYTIGLHHNYDHPELIIFGLPADTAHVLLNIAGEAIKAGRSFHADTPYDDFLEGYDCVLKDASPRWHTAFVGYAIWFHQRPDFPLMQLFWPDRDGILPWQTNASDWQRANQPLLHEDSVEAARVGPLLASMGLADR